MMSDAPAAIVEAFDRHASLHIDHWAYRTNDILRDVADRVLAIAGLTADDVSKEGLVLYRTHAVITAWENTEDGKPIVRDGSRVRRVITVDLGEFERVEVTRIADPEPVYVVVPRAS